MKGNEAKTPVGGGNLKRVPSKRYGAPKIATVSMDDVSEPTTGVSGIAGILWPQICALKPGAALKAEFEDSKHADYVRYQLRTKAKANKRFLSSSRPLDGKTRFFWLEKL